MREFYVLGRRQCHSYLKNVIISNNEINIIYAHMSCKQKKNEKMKNVLQILGPCFRDHCIYVCVWLYSSLLGLGRFSNS
jgi:hypothetical protein